MFYSINIVVSDVVKEKRDINHHSKNRAVHFQFLPLLQEGVRWSDLG